ncbi:hypothetical protein BT67DRAFT_53515 [Trichocladium antarcticum]|uniref:Uncharacterized protein n=1 Tax=Trichocladium antarcticum TaxID=1450529 RepID=A0AAN6UIC9_9PEZI|nr:hypothetical protein BT67DRAFT_53515 [Trichocladium antarcticum]
MVWGSGLLSPGALSTRNAWPSEVVPRAMVIETASPFRNENLTTGTRSGVEAGQSGVVHSSCRALANARANHRPAKRLPRRNWAGRRIPWPGPAGPASPGHHQGPKDRLTAQGKRGYRELNIRIQDSATGLVRSRTSTRESIGRMLSQGFVRLQDSDVQV